MTGLILAGGEGTRLRPLTTIVNKHLLPIYDRPMIDYPIDTLKNMGCKSIVIVSGGNNIGGFAEYLGDGSRHDVDITYRVQTEAGGIAQALKCAKGLVSGLFPVILGDNYFEIAPEMPSQPTLYTKDVPDPNRYGVYFDGKIIEKPSTFLSNKAVTGLYVYDEKCFEIADKLQPSARGELEVTDINNVYLKLGAEVTELSGLWMDMGTFESMNDVSNHVRDKS
jgi:glucose-1-phosphate thymidylyltransferase